MVVVKEVELDSTKGFLKDKNLEFCLVLLKAWKWVELRVSSTEMLLALERESLKERL